MENLEEYFLKSVDVGWLNFVQKADKHRG